jgi:NhaP-type Na+/H+ or K+/H+ antiporter
MLGLGLLGLHELGDSGLRWVLVDVLWATAAGIAIGVAAGVALAHGGRKLRRLAPTQTLMNDFLGLGLIGVVYGLSVMVNAWGFLAVFFAAVALRQTEVRQLNACPPNLAQQADPDLEPVGPAAAPQAATETISAQALVFKEHLERLSELMLVLLIGGSLFLDSWSWRAVALALFVFAVVRPVSVLAGLMGTRTPWTTRSLVAWFGVRGIGSLYYLMYAIQHGLPEGLALELMQFTLIVVTLSIFVHGTSVKPLLGRFWRHRHNLPEWRKGQGPPPPGQL